MDEQRCRRANDLEIDLSKKDFFDNLVFDDPKECNAFYTHHLFKESHNKFDWRKATNGSWQFGYRKQRGYFQTTKIVYKSFKLLLLKNC